MNRGTLSTVVSVNGMTRAVNIATYQVEGDRYVINNLLTGDVVKVLPYPNPLRNALVKMWIKATIQLAQELSPHTEKLVVHRAVVAAVTDSLTSEKIVKVDL